MIVTSFVVAGLAWAHVAHALPQVTGVTSTATPTGPPQGAVTTDVLAPAIPDLPPGPDASSYPRDGTLHAPEPAPYTPAGGLGQNGSEPNYQVKSDFDFESMALGLYQEWIELDLFRYGLVRFTAAEFDAAGLNAEDRTLIEFMAQQEVGHATLLTNMLGEKAPVPCTYTYPFTTVREFVDFVQKLTRWGESGVYGFLEHMDSRESATLLLQSITTEARQQMIFRQFDGLFPMPVWFEVGIPQSWAWTLLAPFVASCPANQTRLAWQNFPTLNVVNEPNPVRTDPNATGFNEPITSIPLTAACRESCNPAITHNRNIPLSYPGKVVYLAWEPPGQTVGPDQSYVTSTSAGAPAFVAWVSQLNVTYSPLTCTSNGTGTTIQPDVSVYAGDPAINGTMFVAITDTDLNLTPFNLSKINPHVVAGPALYQAG
ncbi:MAG: hypothetical protein M1826_001282 [Phylliscum demangeonii]|nr:MAG: hypothetical protein M1826_001282 [Phylliscum demangeonii]